MAQAPIKLSAKNLPELKAAGVSVPTYDRSKMKEGIVHFGVGGFHRSHLAEYIHLLATKHNVIDWSICGVGLMPADISMRDALVGQDCLYTIVERSAEGSKPHVVGSITSYLYAPSNPEAVIAKLAHADTRIVSLTITESGYFFSETTGELDVKHPDIAADLQNKGSAAPKTVYGYIVAALARRRQAGLPPFTVMSCDNIVQNGHLVKKMVLTFAKHIDQDLGAWLETNGAFPNSMVDRITPRTTSEDSQALGDKFGIIDAWPVVTEPFIQWVIEDTFSAGRPTWDKVGVQMVHEVEPFEKMKLRLLNASHSAMGYLGYLAGHTYIHEVILDPQFRKYIRGMMDKEVRPLLPTIPGINLDDYCNTLIERFSNPTIGDHVTRICLDGSGKMPKFILPSVHDQIARNGELKRLALCVAAWFRYLTGKDEQGKEFTIEDPMAAELQALALKGGSDPETLLGVTRLFGDDLRKSPAFLKELTSHLESLYKHGARATLAKVIGE